jgi:proteasome lid subunit RPN8/RPN11
MKHVTGPIRALWSRAPRYEFRPTRMSSRIHHLDTAVINAPAPLVFTAQAYDAIRTTVGAMPAETGGPLGGTRGSGVVEEYYHDHTSNMTAVTYYPDFQRLNAMFRDSWNPAGINLLGVVHSHPHGAIRPSQPDAEYASRIMQTIPELDRFLLPIAQTLPNTGAFTIRGYAAARVRIDDLDTIVLSPRLERDVAIAEFDRVQRSYDLQVMDRARIVAIGGGGSASFLEDMARAGIGEIVIVDPDLVEAPNVATQQAYRSDIGRPKVSAIADRLVNISPTVRVWTVKAYLDDLEDAGVRQLVSGWLPGGEHPSPAATALCAFTDNFEAQGRIHRLGLHLGVPVIGGAVYAEGRGVEVTFAAAGVTRACIRCAQSSRYAAYLDDGYQNDVGSAGAPVWATARLNALKQPIALGLLHTLSRVADPEHPATVRYRRLLTSIENRNLVLASLDPDVHETLGLAPFLRHAGDGTVAGSDVETTLWRSPVPDHPDNGFTTCPDCGGTGDLSTSMGRFMDTTPMPRVFGEHRYDSPVTV